MASHKKERHNPVWYGLLQTCVYACLCVCAACLCVPRASQACAHTDMTLRQALSLAGHVRRGCEHINRDCQPGVCCFSTLANQWRIPRARRRCEGWHRRSSAVADPIKGDSLSSSQRMNKGPTNSLYGSGDSPSLNAISRGTGWEDFSAIDVTQFTPIDMWTQNSYFPLN